MTKSIETQLNASTESQTAGSSEIARDAFVKRGLASIAALGGLALGTPAPAVADERHIVLIDLAMNLLAVRLENLRLQLIRMPIKSVPL